MIVLTFDCEDCGITDRVILLLSDVDLRDLADRKAVQVPAQSLPPDAPVLWLAAPEDPEGFVKSASDLDVADPHAPVLILQILQDLAQAQAKDPTS